MQTASANCNTTAQVVNNIETSINNILEAIDGMCETIAALKILAEPMTSATCKDKVKAIAKTEVMPKPQGKAAIATMITTDAITAPQTIIGVADITKPETMPEVEEVPAGFSGALLVEIEQDLRKQQQECALVLHQARSLAWRAVQYTPARPQAANCCLRWIHLAITWAGRRQYNELQNTLNTLYNDLKHGLNTLFI